MPRVEERPSGTPVRRFEGPGDSRSKTMKSMLHIDPVEFPTVSVVLCWFSHSEEFSRQRRCGTLVSLRPTLAEPLQNAGDRPRPGTKLSKVISYMCVTAIYMHLLEGVEKRHFRTPRPRRFDWLGLVKRLASSTHPLDLTIIPNLMCIRRLDSAETRSEPSSGRCELSGERSARGGCEIRTQYRW